jgi:nucleobase:cation symporter-1, NCS1 family
MRFMLGLDLVIAMPISWMPLVSDYTRYAAVPGRGIRGTWWGYFLVSSWMFAAGLIASIATGSGAPERCCCSSWARTACWCRRCSSCCCPR